MDNDLQWGRDLTVTESRVSVALAEAAIALQWGRDLTVTESVAMSGRFSATWHLQWGRDLTVTESETTVTLASGYVTFNGAAT